MKLDTILNIGLRPLNRAHFGRKRVKISLPKHEKIIFKYPLIAQGFMCNENRRWITLKMMKSQSENPIKYYEWKTHTEAIDALESLTKSFIEEYKETVSN